MKVKIIKCDSNILWYYDYIGYEIDVIYQHITTYDIPPLYKSIDDRFIDKMLLVEDCITLSEIRSKKLKSL